jgi:mannan endo-1,4-beta-mannosidase
MTTSRRKTAHIFLKAALVSAILLSQAILGCTAHNPPISAVSTTSASAVQSTSLNYQPVPASSLTIRVSPGGKVLAPLQGTYTGVFKEGAPSSTTPLDSYAKVSGKKPAIVMWYQSWMTGFDPALPNNVLKRGAIPMITWEPWNPGGSPHDLQHPANQPDFKLSKIVDGKYDAYIRTWAQGVKSVNGPVMIRLMHEMNGNWYPWCGTVNGNSPADFRAAWRHVHAVFDAEGVKNVTWVWSINHASNRNTYANRYSVYYPGDAYVDWTSISGFNWAKSPGSPRNQSFEAIDGAALAYLRTLKKPIAISEMACDNGAHKPGWIRDAYNQVLVNHHEVKGIVYYDKREVGLSGTQNWQVASSKASAAAYRSALSSRMFIGGASKSLLSSLSAKP